MAAPAKPRVFCLLRGRLPVWIALLAALAVGTGCGEKGTNAATDDDAELDESSGENGDEDAAETPETEEEHEAETAPQDPVARTAATMACLRDPDCRRTFVCAHRGYRPDESVPEDSRLSVRKTIEAGIEIVELDPRDTADDGLVLMHDATLDRTTTGRGEVSAFTVAQIQALRLKAAGDAADPEAWRVPTLAEALAVGAGGQVVFNLDLKTDRLDLVVQAIDQAGAFGYTIGSSSSEDKVSRLRALDPRMQVMYRIPDLAGVDRVRAAAPEIFLVEWQLDSFDPARHQGFLDGCRARGLKVLLDALGVDDLRVELQNDTSGWEEMIAGGVDVIQTDLPARLLEVIAARAPAETRGAETR